MPKMHLKQPRFTNRPCQPFTKNKETILKFKEIQNTFTEMNQIKLVLNMTWLMEILRNDQKGQFQINV